jgi:metallo-beta-lactamase family protein
MCTGGRIKYHLTANITRPESTILFVGYQAAGTLGRQILDGASEVRILGDFYPVKAKVVQMSGFSSHADSRQLLKWLYNLKSAPRKVFVVHGEPESADHLVDEVRKDKGWDIVAPALRDEFNLD